MNQIPAGVVLPFASSTAPDGWLLCYGQAVSRTTYAHLFAIISTTYGTGDGSTTFNLPDLRGRVPAGLDNMGGAAASRLTSAVLSASNTMGATGGTQTHTMVTSEMPAHGHTQDAHTHTQDAHTHTQNSHNHDFAINSSGVSDAGTGGPALNNSDATGSTIWRSGSSGNHTTVVQSKTPTNQNTTATNQNTTATNQNTGGGGAHLNTQPTLVLAYIIKT